MNQTRNLNPTREAIFAMYHWHKEYAEQLGGSMDFWDSLSDQDKNYCSRVVEAITTKSIQ